MRGPKSQARATPPLARSGNAIGERRSRRYDPDMADVARRRITLAEYFGMAEISTLRLEYLDGAVYAMAGAELEHNDVAANVLAC